ncbi:sigma-54-dependent Fis family transcriptional regulator [Candidatus Aerophobetes bacterium]|nr:sigma-54-dependent Fis family transcriptional regulator [Candidatus Aerophobetes bacterium]
MRNNRPTILVIDDELLVHKVILRLLKPEFSVEKALCGQEGLKKIELMTPDLILLDLRMPKMSGMSVLKKVVGKNEDIPVIILTAYGNVSSAVEAIKLGAADYIEKPFDNQKLKRMLEKLLERKKNIQTVADEMGIVGKSPQVQKAWELVKKFGPTDIPILLQGETGTGKELFSRAVHFLSKRHREAFVPVDCSSLPESLIESELFGYKKGAFTDADKDKAGRLDCAHGGTLFLDEIGNLPTKDQIKLLRVLQEKQYIPLGAKEAKSLDVRVVSASNANLKEAIERGNFREDLYYRISGVVIELPCLREREGDVETLTRYFVEKYGRKYNKPNVEISDEATHLLCSYGWPGNVRELEYVIARAAVLSDKVIFPSHLLLYSQKKSFTSGENYAEGINVEVKFDSSFKGPIDLKKVKKKVSRKI